MKRYLFLIALVFAVSLQAQKTKTNTAKFDFVHYPTVPVEGLKNLGIQVYTADLSFNKDTLRLYLDNLDLMKSDAEQLSKIQYQSINEVQLTGGKGDLTASMALGEPVILSKEFKTNSCIPPKDGCSQYYYQVQYQLPAYVEISNSLGHSDTWKLSPEMSLKFGNEQVETHTETDQGTITSIKVVSFESEMELALAFSDYGEAWLVRKGIVKQMSNMAETIYREVFFEDEKLKLDFHYGSGTAADYSETEAAAEKAVEALENKNYAALIGPIDTWKTWLEKYDANDKKAAVNDKVAQGLHENLSIGYTFTGEFEKAKNHLKESLELAQSGNVNINEVDRLKKFKTFIKDQEKAKKYNDGIELSEMVAAPDIKKTLGRRNRNADMEFLIAEDQYANMAKAYTAANPNQDIGEMNVEEFMSMEVDESTSSTEEISLEGRVENDMLILSGLVDGNMRGKALPSSICDYPDIKVIRAKNIGLTALPDCMRNLTNLEKFIVGFNSFESLPDAFGDMKNLEVLDISNNNLKAIPPSLYTLSNLKKISIEGNQFSEEEIDKLKAAFPKAKFK